MDPWDREFTDCSTLESRGTNVADASKIQPVLRIAKWLGIIALAWLALTWGRSCSDARPEDLPAHGGGSVYEVAFNGL